jgi:group II intron reverse transcriptase/maturase
MEPLEGNMTKTSNFEIVSTRQQRIATLAKQSPPMGFTSLNHHLDLPWLYEAYRRTRKDGAVGVDGQTAKDYEADLEANLQSLLDRAKSGTYRAPAVRRVRIPKGTGNQTRPIGVPTFEDKVLQRAVALVLEPIYETDFHDGSYGFRPGRSAHQALQELWDTTMASGGGWVLEVDIRDFFDTLDHAHLRALLRRRVRDGVILRLIGKWLNAGVLDEGRVYHPEAGTPQGGVLSPLLANLYLHYVLDEWFAEVVEPRMRGHCFLIRYADDFVLGFTREDDARRVRAVLARRFERFGLALHPDKTRLVSFQRPRPGPPRTGGSGKGGTGTFTLLGFTHYWGKSRKGNWVVKRKTEAKRLTRAIQAVYHWCRVNRHRPIREQHQALSRKMHGHYTYYGITCNGPSLSSFRVGVTRSWRKWLSRRKRGRPIPWPRFQRLLARYPLPPETVVHSVYRTAAKP